MTATKDTSIRLKETTRLRFDALKGSKTYDTFLSEMLTYFETTGIMPHTQMVSPVVAVKEQASRIIEVVRGIEKSQKATLKMIVDKLNDLTMPQSISSIPVGANSEEYMHIQDVQNLLDEAERLRQAVAHKDEELTTLRTQIEINAKKGPAAHAGAGNTAQIKKFLVETTNVFDNRKKTSTFNDDIYEFDRNAFDEWINRLRSDINKL